MQSVYKLPIAIAVLRLVDEGKISLDQSVTITRQEFAPGWSPIIKEFRGDSAHATNDVGIASSPDGKRVAIAVFIAGSKAPLEVREKVMSDIASAVFRRQKYEGRRQKGTHV
jgi:Beta-lactamase enzyme family